MKVAWQCVVLPAGGLCAGPVKIRAWPRIRFKVQRIRSSWLRLAQGPESVLGTCTINILPAHSACRNPVTCWRWGLRGEREPCGPDAVLLSGCSLLCRTAGLLVTVILTLRCVGDEIWGTRDHCFRTVGFGQAAVPMRVLSVLSVPPVPWFLFIYLRADLSLTVLGPGY